MKKAAFAAGCFWGVESVFREIEGVIDARVGYMGGNVNEPTYKLVCTNKTGHAETIEISYAPDLVSYERLLETFWKMHDPTQLNRQGVDVGSQYRSMIFYYDEGQKEEALDSKKKLQASGKYDMPIVTEIVPASKFWPAEEYHQRYNEKHGIKSCHI
ncbi:MAG: peptide-methionine (S)-S-oxide reductase MsrA [Euryarchaeota archaeon]|nr:peptide-methionine (S)-S-oxide reductase MsrA [Euryarchaeota archaeon]